MFYKRKKDNDLKIYSLINKYPLQSTWIDYPDNESLAVIFYLYGCSNICYKCHNLSFKEDNSNSLIFNYSIDVMYSYINNYCKKYKTNKIIFSGGDPLYIKNIDFIRKFLKLNKKKKLFDICIYTGYDITYVKDNDITNFNFIKCGFYEDSLKQISEKTDNYIQFASSNQKLYNSNYELISNNHGRYYFKGRN